MNREMTGDQREKPRQKMKNEWTTIAFLVLSGIGSNSLADQRPNIVFAFADDWGRHASVYAEVDGPGTENDVAQTPNFDRLAKQGVLFSNAFVNAPSCTPCRSSILSGQHFWRTGRGAILQGAVWDSQIPSWPLLLQSNGYHIGYTWKVWSPGTPKDAPFGAKKNSYSGAGRQFNQFSQYVTSALDSGQTETDSKLLLLKEVRKNFRNMLDETEGKPFAYWFGPTNVHRKWTKGSGKRLWKIDPDLLKGKLPQFLPDVPEVRQDFADYLGEVNAFDTALGILIDELKVAGVYNNTLIVVSGDHGPAGFPHGKCNLYDFGTRVSLCIAGPNVRGGRVVQDFTSLPDLAPTFLAAGKTKIPDVMTGKSLWPTLTSNESGLVDPTRTEVFSGRERHVAGARAGNLPYPQRAIRNKDYLYIINFKPDRYPLGDPKNLDEGSSEPTIDRLTNNTFCTLADEDAGPTKAWIVSNRNRPDVKPYYENAYGRRPMEELYDLKNDPHQMVNVAALRKYQNVKSTLKRRLISTLESTLDPRMIDEGEFFEKPPLAGPLK
ncbi:MAG: sulfatase [Mariniblastus sp.]|nr:sulfatase [Mariniblastus sp.]